VQIIHHFVEVLDRYFGNVCELDLIFNFHKVGHMHSPLLAARFTSDSASIHADACAVWRCTSLFGMSKAHADTDTDTTSAWSDLWHLRRGQLGVICGV
jgi:Clathrin adaptor complex small chain